MTMRVGNMSVLERLIALTVPAFVMACATSASGPLPKPIDAAAFENHLAMLASDEFEGRKPGTRGEERTLEYLTREFKKLGFKPGNGESFLQPVPMVEITAASDAALKFDHGSTTENLAYTEDMVIWTKRVVADAAIDSSPLVFVGYGVTAPEYGWDDYAGLDMRGKTAVILVNDPGFEIGDSTLFRGKAMTYYGRWTYKFEEAARRGAAGALIVHDTVPAAYGWETVVNSWTGPQLDQASGDGNASRVAIEGWITQAAAEKLFAANGTTYAAAKQRANQRGFKPEALATRATAAVRNGIRRANSANVVAVLPGAKRPHEYVIYMAHWDHLGRMLGKSGDVTFNGAVDNASGTAGMLAIARAFTRGKRLERSVLFLGITLEESGLLGSAYYADNPVVPLTQTVAAINMDALFNGGPKKDVVVIGYGASELEGYLARAAARQGRVLRAETTPEKGFFYRSDHFNLAKRGVPALYIKLGVDDREKGEPWGLQQEVDYVAQRYHKVTDNYAPGMDWRGAVEDLNLLYAVGSQLANERTFPNWHADNEFRAIRDRSLATMSR
jgi:Zn-dependent M28 family amino/carboxypeptidase